MAKGRRNNKVTLLGVTRRKRPALMMSTALQATTLLVLSLPVHAAPPAPNALPTGFAPTAGNLSAAQSGNKLTITQTTQRGAANFQSFNIGKDAAVQYVQPSSSATTLNRVVGPDPSQIAGRIDANGKIILINQSGVNFYKGSQVNTAGLIVTTANMTDKNFMAGNMKFDEASKNPNAAINNAGNITISDAGLAALVAPQVRNSGTITAQMGHVVLAGAKTATIDLYGDGMLSLDVTNQVTQAPVGKDGKTATALVTNEGVIIADGGTVQLTARAADGIVQNLVQAGGKIRAATMGDQTGVVALNGVGGNIVVEGQLSAPGYAPGTKGGDIEVAASGNVVVEAGARINASGKAGGGNIGIGTTLDRVKGGPGVTPTLVAANTTIKQGAKISANATDKGNGGRVVVLSDMSKGTTRMDGAIAARGGKQVGDGGFVEVSGAKLGTQTGQIDTSAPHGQVGTILFDPQDLDIVAAGTGNGNVTAGGVDVAAPDQDTNITVSGAVLTALTGNLLIEASRNLTVDTPLAFTQIAGKSVTMLAGANLTVNQAVSTLGGDLIFRAAVTTDGVTSFTHTDPAGAITINAALGNATTGNITLSAGTGGIGLGANVTGLTVDLSSTGAVNQTGGVVTATTLQSTGNVAGNVSLTKANKIDAIGNFTVTGGNSFTLNNSVGLAVNGALVATGGNAQLQTSNNAGITVGAAGSVNVGNGAGGGTAGFTADKFSITAGGAITAHVFELAPNTAGTMKIGTGGLLTSLTGITADLVRLGRANSVTTASLIDVRSNFDFGGANVDLFSTGGITAAANALQNVNTLTVAAAGDVDLSNAANSISALTGTVTGASNSLTLIDTSNLTVGDLSVGKNVSLTTTGATKITVTGTVSAGTALALASGTSGIALNAGDILSAATVDLSAAGGGVTQNATGTINATTLLQSSSGVTGTVNLAGANTIAAVGNFAVTTGDFIASLRGSSGVSGTLAADNVSLTSIAASTQNVTGTIQSSGTTTLSSGSVTVGSTGVVQGTTITINSGVDVAFNGNAVLGKAGQTNVLDVSTTVGNVTEASTATINAGTLQSASGINGNVNLIGTGNSIAAIGGLAATGTVTVLDTAALAVNGKLSSNSNIFLQTSKAAGITVGAAGKVAAGAASLASFQADKLAVTAGGTITGGTFQFALNTPGALTLGAGGSLASLAGIGTSNAVLGGVTVPGSGFTVTATSLDTVASFDGNGLPVALRSTGTIGEAAASPIVNVTTLTGSATAVKLDQANGIANLGSFSATAGDFLLTDPVATLTVSGPVTGTNVSINGATTLAVTGSIGATTTAALGAVEIDIATTGTVTGTTVQLNAGANGINLIGNAVIGKTGGTVDIKSTGTVTEAATSIINAGTLESTGGIGGDVSLLGTANAFANLGAFAVTGNAALVDGSAVNVIGNVSVAGAGKQLALQAPSITVKATGALNADTGSGLISLHTDTFGGNSGTIKSATLELAPITVGRGMTLGAAGNLSLASLTGITTGNLVLGAFTPPGGARTTTAGAITIGGTFDTTGVSIVILDGSGAVTQTAPLIGGSQLFGDAANFILLNSGNLIAALGLTASGGNIQVIDKSAVTLGANSAIGSIYFASPDATLTGAISASGVLGLQTDKFTFVAGSLSGTTVELAPLTSGTTETLGAAGGLSLLSDSFITGNLRIGAVTVPGSGLTTTAGLIDIGGNFGSAGLVLELDSLGGITESAGALTAATLTGTANGTVNLNSANAIATLGSFNPGAHTFTLFDNGLAGNLTVNGPVTGTTITIAAAPTITVAGSVAATSKTSMTSGAGGLIVQSGGNVTGPDVVLDALGGGISLTGTGKIGSAGGTVDLSTSGSGNVAEAAGAVVTAGTLISGSGIGGSLNLSAGANDIANLGSILTVGSINISDAGHTGAFGVAGPLSATNVTVTSGTGALTVTGSIFADFTISLDGSNPSAGVALNSGAILTAPTIALNGGATGIAINGTASVGTATSIVDLTTTGGGVTEVATAKITAATLRSTGGVVGNVNLIGTTNAIAGLGNFAVTGGSNHFALDDSVLLTVGGTVTGPGQVYLQTSNPAGIAIAVGGSVGAGTLASFQADALTNSGTISGTQFEWAPDTTLATQTLLSLNNIPTNVRIGAVTLPGAGSPTIRAGSIVVGANFGTSSTILELDSAGGISEAGAFAITANSLTGEAGADVTLANGNAIANLGTFAVGGVSTFKLNDSSALAITGLVSSSTVDLNGAAGITETTGVINATVLRSSGGVTGNVTLNGLNNVATLASFPVTSGDFSMSDGGAAAGLLVTGPVTANNVTIASGLGQLKVSGSIGASSTVSLDGSTPTGGVALNSGAFVTGSTIDINGGTIGITLNGNASLGNSGAVVDLTTTGNGVIEASTAKITAGTLQSTGGIVGIVSLAGAANAIANIGSLAVTGGSFSLIDTGNLNVAGKLTASDITLNDSGTLTVSDSLLATGTASLTAAAIAIPGLVNGGTVGLFSTSGTIDESGTLIAAVLTGSAATTATLLGATPATNQVTSVGNFVASGFTLNNGITLSINGTLNGGPSVTLLDKGTLTIASGGTVTASAIGLTADNITIAGLSSDGGGAGATNLVATTGTISESGTIIAGTLTGSSFGATNLAGATATTNQISNLGNFTADGFSLNDGTDLTVVGVLAGGPSATILDKGALLVAAATGTVSANSVGLTGDTISIAGLVTDGGLGTVSLTSKVGGITESGTLIAGTLSGSAATSASLLGATTTTNQVATVGTFTATTGFAMDDGIDVTVAGKLNGGTAVTVLDKGTLTIASGGTVTATGIGLTADNISIKGVSTDGGGAGTTNLVATSGTIDETGTLIAGTLTGSSIGATTLTGATPTINQVGTLGNFNAGSFKLNDGTALNVAGTVQGGSSVAIVDANTLTVSGTVNAPTISLTGGDIAILGSGLVTDGGAGSVSLVATINAINEVGTIIAGTLTGSAIGVANLAGATTTTNQIATLGNFTATGFTLNDGIALNITAAVAGGPSVTVLDKGALSIAATGTVSATAITLTGDTIANSGLITDGGAGTVTLVSTAGGITDPGILIAGTLFGSAATSASLLGATTTSNQVANIGTFVAATGFTLDDGVSLTVLGTLNGGTSATILDTGTATIASGGTVTAAAISLTADNISIKGLSTDGGAGTTNLVASTGTIDETGTIIAGTLTGSAASSVSLAGTAFSNQIATLASFSATDFALNDGIDLNVAGPLTVSKSATIVDTAALLVSGTIAPSSGNISVALTAATIDIPGFVSDGGAGTMSLVATTGTIGETGTLISGTLTGSAASSASLTGTSFSNQIGTVNGFTAVGLTLDDGIDLTVLGTIAGGPNVAIADKGALGITGTVTATAVSLTADSITIPGNVTGTSVALFGTVGAISETGVINAGTLTGSAVTTASLTGTSFSNQIGTLNGFSAAGFTLDDGIGLTVLGTVAGGPSATILDKGALAIGGTVTATAVSLTADSITIPGNVTGTSVALFGTVGAISETGVINAGTLTGGAVTTASLTGTSFSNQIGTLNGFAAAGLTLDDGIDLVVLGTVAGGPSVTVADKGALAINGTVTATAVSLTADSITIPGNVTGTTVGLFGTIGAISETGVINAGTLTGSAATTASLTGTSFSNKIGTVNGFSAVGLTLNDDIDLVVTGTVAGGPSVTVADKGALTINGTVTATAVSLTADSITIPGNVTGTTVGLFGTLGAIAETGVINAGTLTGSAATSASLTGTSFSNQIGTLSGFSAAAGLTLIDGAPLTVTGSVSGGPSVTVQDKGALAINGAVSAAAVSLAADSITIPGSITGTTVALFGTVGAISETGIITAGTLSGSAVTTASFTGTSFSNQIATVNNFTASGLTLNDGSDLTITGNVNGGPSATVVGAKGITVAAGSVLTGNTLAVTANNNIDITGVVQGGSSVSLVSNTGSITESGTVITPLLTGRSALDTNLLGTNNQIAQLGSFTVATPNAFRLNDAINLLVTGPLSAQTIVINTGNNTITLADNAQIITGGTTRPTGSLTSFPGDTPGTESNGAFFTTAGGFTQLGSSFVSGIGGGPSIFRVTATGAANIAFDTGAGLQGKNTTWLILDIDTGRASGQVNVQALDVIRHGSTGSTDLTGTVANLSGSAAAGASGIQPSPNSNFRFNQCPIHSVNCVLLPTQGIPIANPLNDIYFGTLFNPDDQDDLLLPIVSDQDY